MVEFIRAGGPAIWSVIVFGLITIVASVIYIVKGDVRRVAVIRALTGATLFATLTAVASDFEAVAWHVPRMDLPRADVPFVVMQGIGESLAPAVTGFAILSLTWLLVAVGTRRHRHDA